MFKNFLLLCSFLFFVQKNWSIDLNFHSRIVNSVNGLPECPSRYLEQLTFFSELVEKRYFGRAERDDRLDYRGVDFDLNAYLRVQELYRGIHTDQGSRKTFYRLRSASSTHVSLLCEADINNKKQQFLVEVKFGPISTLRQWTPVGGTFGNSEEFNISYQPFNNDWNTSGFDFSEMDKRPNIKRSNAKSSLSWGAFGHLFLNPIGTMTDEDALKRVRDIIERQAAQDLMQDYNSRWGSWLSFRKAERPLCKFFVNPAMATDSAQDMSSHYSDDENVSNENTDVSSQHSDYDENVSNENSQNDI